MSDELQEKAKIIAEATGRTIEDVLDDLGDDGILNESNKSEKDLITQLKEAAELISTVQQINNEVSENTVLNGGDNKTEVSIETTLEGDIVDRAIASVSRKVVNLKKIAIIIIPVFLLLTGGSMSNMGMFSNDDSPPDTYDEYYDNSYGGCLNPDAENYDEYASWDDGSCYWDDEDEIIWGCMDNSADNFDPNANEDDGSCHYEEPLNEGCTDSDAENYDDEAEEDDGSCTYPEPEPETCEGNASFYSVTYEWLNETNDTISLKVLWDADWSCDETQDIEIDLYLKDANESTVYANTFAYGTNYNDLDTKSFTITNISKPTTGQKLCMTIWVDVTGYRMDEEWSEVLQ